MLSMRLHAQHGNSHSSASPNNSNSPISPKSNNSVSPVSPIANPVSTPATARPAVPNSLPPPPTPTSPTSPQGYAASLAPSASSRSVRSVATAPRALWILEPIFCLVIFFLLAREIPLCQFTSFSTGHRHRAPGLEHQLGERKSCGGAERPVRPGERAAPFVERGVLQLVWLRHVGLGILCACRASAIHVKSGYAGGGGRIGGKFCADGEFVGWWLEYEWKVARWRWQRDLDVSWPARAPDRGPPKRRTLNALGNAFGGPPVTPLQPPPRKKRWTAVSDSAAASSFSPFTRASGEESELKEESERGVATHPYANGYASGSYFSPFSSSKRPGSASGARPGSAGGSGSSPTTPGMYAHPHANGSAGTAGSFGVPSVHTGTGRMRDGSVKGLGREGSVRTAGSIRDVNGYVNGRNHSTDRLSERSVSTGTGTGQSRSRASSVGNTPSSGIPNGANGVNGSAGNVNGNGNANGKARRWSTLPKRLTPPASSPPATPATSTGAGAGAGTIPHPYAAAALSSTSSERESRDRPPSRSSFGSAGKGSRSSFGSAPWTRGGKRASGISVGSIGAVSSGVSGGSVGTANEKRESNGSGKSVTGALTAASASPPAPAATAPSRAGNRLSVPPPPRPAPTGALPPAPGESGSPNGRTSFSSIGESRTSFNSVRESTPRTSFNRESRSSSLSVSFREPPPPVTSSKSAPLPAPTASARPAAHSKSATSTGSSFRESMAMTHRALRLSLLAPKPPPAGVLPPRPDEVVPPRRESIGLGRPRTGTSESGGSGLYAIPSSPVFPPPRGPLPAPPVVAPAPVPAPSLGPVRHTSLKLKQRLRILSAPPAPHPAAQQQQQVQSQHSTPAPQSRPTSADATVPPPRPARSKARPGPMTLATFLSASTPSTPTTAAPVPLSPAAFAAAIANAGGLHGTPPATPIGEKIIQFHTQNDPSFLELSTGSTPIIPARTLPGLSGSSEDPPAPESEYAEIVSLPPPRRGSRQISIKDVERAPTPPPDPAAIPLPPDTEDDGVGPGPGNLFSLSRNGSVVSLGIVTM
ncbi:hypothetical protein MVEN_00406400 [Mycena venus]|uniref:Uncharacterized protein n=1 Tax=Mycena venus TaxID=2733690 RepID=A0A8H6YVB4_9AGAR|nr:hypothetical protein MVEN_00406400 [Mycena venus]